MGQIGRGVVKLELTDQNEDSWHLFRMTFRSIESISKKDTIIAGI